MRRSSSLRLGLLLTVSALLAGCASEDRPERRCVDDDGRFVDESLCKGAMAGGGASGSAGQEGAAGASGSWEATGPAAVHRPGYHFIWIPIGTYGGPGTYAVGFQRPVPGSGAPGAAGAAAAPGAASSATSRGGFGATGAGKAGAAATGGSAAS